MLYRKYRSRSFDEIAGQQHITETLKRAVANGAIAHAYLFTGPRGVGKTSVARILAYAVNQLPYSDDTEHLDIIEIDAASNRRIDEIRDLREKVHTAPAAAKFKVYIIDEVHMLTNEAFNALLKTLEEPPSHAIFILATTEAHKVPDTIISRTQRFNFRPVESTIMSDRLADIAKREKMTIDQAALNLIASHARGSFRDALTILDQLRSHEGRIKSEEVEALLGLAPHQAIENLLYSFMSDPPEQVFTTLSELLDRGISSQNAAKALSGLARDHMLANPELITILLPLVEKLLDVEGSLDARLRLEAAIAATLPRISGRAAEIIKPPQIETESKKSEQQIIIEPPTSITAEADTAQPRPKSSNKPKGNFDWPKLMAAAKTQSEPLYALLRMAHPEFDDKANRLTIKFRFAFHAKRFDSTKQQSIFKDLLKGQLSDIPEMIIMHDPAVEAEPTDKTLTAVADILDGEIIEIEETGLMNG